MYTILSFFIYNCCHKVQNLFVCCFHKKKREPRKKKKKTKFSKFFIWLIFIYHQCLFTLKSWDRTSHRLLPILYCIAYSIYYSIYENKIVGFQLLNSCIMYFMLHLCTYYMLGSVWKLLVVLIQKVLMFNVLQILCYENININLNKFVIVD